jgi:GNAT superfamily N-acetyltransferase
VPEELPKIKLVKILPLEFCEIWLQGIFPKGAQRLRRGRLGKAVWEKSIKRTAKALEGEGMLFKIINDDEAFGHVGRGETVGVCGLKISGQQAHLFNLYVLRQCRGNGFGKAARIERERIAKEKGANTVTADVSFFNFRQRKRLTRNGYERKGIIPRRGYYTRFRRNI